MKRLEKQLNLRYSICGTVTDNLEAVVCEKLTTVLRGVLCRLGGRDGRAYHGISTRCKWDKINSFHFFDAPSHNRFICFWLSPSQIRFQCCLPPTVSLLFHQRTSHVPCVLCRFSLLFFVHPTLAEPPTSGICLDLTSLLYCVVVHFYASIPTSDTFIYFVFFRSENSRVKSLPCTSSSANRRSAVRLPPGRRRIATAASDRTAYSHIMTGSD